MKIAYGMLKQAVGESMLEHIGICCDWRETEMLQHCLDLVPECDTLLSEVFDAPVIAQLIAIFT